MVYLFIDACHAFIAILVIIFIVLAVIRIKKHEEVGKFLRTGIIAGILLGSMITLWYISHGSCPMINDWEFLGEDIDSIEQQYGEFRWYSKGEDGSGYAVLMTETITGQHMYDSGPDSCYYMEFDQTGKIIKVYCGRPIGG